MLAASVFLLPNRRISISARLAARRAEKVPLMASPRQLWMLGALFFLSLLTVAHLLDYRITLAVVVLVTALMVPRYFRYVDYRLLGTFVAFFILIGNISQWEAFRQILAAFLTGHEFLVAIFASQVISNVPAAVLLSGFTDNAAALLLGTDIGGLGTLIASMASLISYGIFVRAYPRRQGYFLKIFTALNVAYLLFFIVFAAVAF